jgi:hypothetical protein
MVAGKQKPRGKPHPYQRQPTKPKVKDTSLPMTSAQRGAATPHAQCTSFAVTYLNALCLVPSPPGLPNK